MTKKTSAVKLILSFLIILIIFPTVLFSQPKKTQAFWPTWDIPNSIFQGSTSVSSGATAASSGLVAVYDSQDLLIDIERVAKEVLRQALIVIGHQLLNQITQSTVNWINSGFHGSPLFVQNPESFFGNIEQTAIKGIVNQVGYDPLQPFGKQFALNIINQYRASSTQDMQYSLSQLTKDPTTLNNYQTNFFYGGWNAFLVNTQYPQNNYLGYTMKMSNTLYGQTTTGNTGNPVQNLAQKAQTLLSQGNGFLSPTMCPPNINPNYNTLTNEFNPPTFTPDANTVNSIPDCQPKPDTASGCANETDIDAAMNADMTAGATTQDIPACVYIFSAGSSGGCSNEDEINADVVAAYTALNAQATTFSQKNTCIDPKTGKSALVATTPGAVVANQITSALNIHTGSSELDAALGNSISVILNALMNHFFQEGLSALSQIVQSAPSIDTWSYNGLTLTGNNITGTNSTGNLTIPTAVSLNVGDTSPTTISGGKAPYTLQAQTSASAQIATATISGGTLSVTGVSQGTTSITVQDSSSPVQTANVTITVGTNGNIVINFNSTAKNPTNIPIGVGSSVNLTMSGGTQPYNIQTEPDSTIALGLVNNNNLTLVGVAAGTTSITLQDSVGQTINLTITVGNETPLIAIPTSVSVVDDGAPSSVALSGGTPPYTITTPPNQATASAFVSGNTLNITGAGAGSTSVTISDAYSPAETATIQITSTAVPTINTTSSAPQNVSVQVGGSTSINILSSDPTIIPTIVTPPNSAIATAQIDTNSGALTILGIAVGNTSLVIQDSNTSSSGTGVVGNGTTSTTTPTNITVNITVAPNTGSNTTF